MKNRTDIVILFKDDKPIREFRSWWDLSQYCDNELKGSPSGYTVGSTNRFVRKLWYRLLIKINK